jgi:hypothetical protein
LSKYSAEELEALIAMLNDGDPPIEDKTAYEDAIEFLDMLSRQLPEWTYDDHSAVLEYITEVLWRDNEMRNS